MYATLREVSKVRLWGVMSRKAVLWCWEMRGLLAGGFEEKVLPFLFFNDP